MAGDGSLPMACDCTDGAVPDAMPGSVGEAADHEWRTAMQHARGYTQLVRHRLADPTMSHDELHLLMGQVLVGLERLRAAQMQMVAPLLAPAVNDEHEAGAAACGDQRGDDRALPESLPAAVAGESPLLLLVAFAVLLLLLSYR